MQQRRVNTDCHSHGRSYGMFSLLKHRQIKFYTDYHTEFNRNIEHVFRKQHLLQLLDFLQQKEKTSAATRRVLRDLTTPKLRLQPGASAQILLQRSQTPKWIWKGCFASKEREEKKEGRKGRKRRKHPPPPPNKFLAAVLATA